MDILKDCFDVVEKRLEPEKAARVSPNTEGKNCSEYLTFSKSGEAPGIVQLDVTFAQTEKMRPVLQHT